MKLYEISDAYRQIEHLMDDETVDETQLLAAIDEVHGELTEKATNIVYFVEGLSATAEAMKAAERRMVERRKAIENRIEHIKAYTLRCMQGAAISKIECAEFKISIRNNPPRVVVLDEASVPLSYFRQPEIPAPVLDKKKIADDIKAGCIVEGCSLEESQRLDIR